MSSLIGSTGAQLPDADSGHVFLFDDAVDADGVLLQDHAIAVTDGARDYVWTKQNIKDRVITDNKIALTGLVDPDGKENDYSINIGERFLTVEGKAQSPSTSFAHIMTLMVRYVDVNNYVGVRWAQFHPIVTTVEIIESVDGAVSPLVTITTDNNYQQTEQIIKIIDDGEIITGMFADETPVQVANTRFNFSPKVGIKNTFDPLATWRDIRVSKT